MLHALPSLADDLCHFSLSLMLFDFFGHLGCRYRVIVVSFLNLSSVMLFMNCAPMFKHSKPGVPIAQRWHERSMQGAGCKMCKMCKMCKNRIPGTWKRMLFSFCWRLFSMFVCSLFKWCVIVLYYAHFSHFFMCHCLVVSRFVCSCFAGGGMQTNDQTTAQQSRNDKKRQSQSPR